MSVTHRRAVSAGIAATALAVLAACGQVPAEQEDDEPAAPTPAAGPVEVSTLDPRVVLTYDGGLMTLDTGTGEVLDDLPLDGFLRVNPAGDGRHVLISTDEGFRAYDAGLEARGHGDHFHYYASPPAITDTLLPAERAGHVVTHAGRTALFADGTGEVQVIDPAALVDGAPPTDTWRAPDPHHGVAVELADHSLVVSVGTEEGRTGAVLLDAERRELARTEDCPGLHGEATARDEVVVLGCEDGPVILRQGEFTKVAVDGEYARSGNLAGHPGSAVVLGDYKTDPDAELERPEQVALIDTTEVSLRLVDLDASYSFRSLGRGPGGEALVLTTDGTLRILDEDSGAELDRVAVTEPWEEPDDWQQPRPALHVVDGVAYVTDPAADRLHTVGISMGTVVRSYDLPHTPNEIAVATGFGAHDVADHDDAEHDGHDHADHGDAEEHAEHDH
ncbi:MAG TPA: zinc metallochaperone AztD [Actinomycetaceae bacterium]|nr:zinc metallochaperone AztD [Actinomycetaceae bacterium]